MSTAVDQEHCLCRFSPRSILIFLDTAYAYVFPEQKLDHPDEFYRYVMNLHQDVADNKQQPSED